MSMTKNARLNSAVPGDYDGTVTDAIGDVLTSFVEDAGGGVKRGVYISLRTGEPSENGGVGGDGRSGSYHVIERNGRLRLGAIQLFRLPLGCALYNNTGNAGDGSSVYASGPTRMAKFARTTTTVESLNHLVKLAGIDEVQAAINGLGAYNTLFGGEFSRVGTLNRKNLSTASDAATIVNTLMEDTHYEALRNVLGERDAESDVWRRAGDDVIVTRFVGGGKNDLRVGRTSSGDMEAAGSSYVEEVVVVEDAKVRFTVAVLCADERNVEQVRSEIEEMVYRVYNLLRGGEMLGEDATTYDQSYRYDVWDSRNRPHRDTLDGAARINRDGQLDVRRGRERYGFLTTQYSADDLAACIDAGYQIVTATERITGTVSGYLLAIDKRRTGDLGKVGERLIREGGLYVRQLAVTEPHVGRGVGRGMYRFLSDRVKGHSSVRVLCSTIVLMPFNEASVRLHEQVGFYLADVQIDADGHTEGVYVLRLDT